MQIRTIKRTLRWIFNPLMLWGMVLGWGISYGCQEIHQGLRNKTGGWLSVGTPDGDGERVRVGQSEYRRHKYTEGEAVLVIGIGVWLYVAYTLASNRRNKIVYAYIRCNQYGCEKRLELPRGQTDIEMDKYLDEKGWTCDMDREGITVVCRDCWDSFDRRMKSG